MEIKIVILPEEDESERAEKNPQKTEEKIWKIEQIGGEEVYTDPEGKTYRQNVRIPR